MEPVRLPQLLLLFLLSPHCLKASSVFRHCPSGQVLSVVDSLCYTCSQCLCQDSVVQDGCLGQGYESSHACLPTQTCTDTEQTLVETLKTDSGTSAELFWILAIFGILGSFIVLCVCAVGVVECVVTVKKCRSNDQHESANENASMESADIEGNHSIQPSSNEGQSNSAYQPDDGLAYQQGACVMVCTAASLSAKVRTNNQNPGHDHLTNFSQSFEVEPVASTSDAEPVASMSEA